jgi:hypothetical protein
VSNGRGGIAVSNNPLTAAGLGGQANLNTEYDVGAAMIQSQQAARAAEQQLENDVRALESHNDATRQLNRRIVDTINAASGQNLDPDPELAQRWAVDQMGMAYRSAPDKPKPTTIENVPLAYQLPNLPGFNPTAAGYNAVRPTAVNGSGHSCFGGGTLVRTQSGTRAIEEMRAGDLVLVQDSKTGALAYQPVVMAYHNPPNATLKVMFDGREAVVATGIHRFWKAGRGWVMSRDLKPGDMLRTVGGTLRVASVEPDATQPVFNLEVAEGQSFFVGERGLLVHDNSLVRPEPQPFDAAPSLAALGVK